MMSFSGEPTKVWDYRCLDADQVQATIQQIHDHLQVEMRRSQAVQKEGAICGQIPAPNILEGLQVWLDTGHIRTTWPTRKFNRKQLGHFSVVLRISHYTCKLDLPVLIRICRVQPVSHLDRVVDDTLARQWVAPPPPVGVDEKEEYQVSSVEDSRVYPNQLQNCIRWTGYDSLTWEPAKLVDGLQAVGEFHPRYSEKAWPWENVLGEPRT